MICDERQNGLDRRFTLAVDPVQVLEQQQGWSRGDRLANPVPDGLVDCPPPQ